MFTLAELSHALGSYAHASVCYLTHKVKLLENNIQEAQKYKELTIKSSGTATKYARIIELHEDPQFWGAIKSIYDDIKGYSF